MASAICDVRRLLVGGGGLTYIKPLRGGSEVARVYDENTHTVGVL